MLFEHGGILAVWKDRVTCPYCWKTLLLKLIVFLIRAAFILEVFKYVYRSQCTVPSILFSQKPFLCFIFLYNFTSAAELSVRADLTQL